MTANASFNLYNVHVTTCCQKSGPSPHRLADLKRNCRIRLFREIASFDDVQDNDYIFPTSAAVIQCEANTLRGIVNEQRNKLIQLQAEIEKYFVLFKFSQCYNHFGQTILLPRLKQMNSPEHTIQKCQYWKNCTQYLGSFDGRNREQNALQEQIYSIVEEHGIDEQTWNAIFNLNNRRNQEIHTPISEQDAIWLNANANKYEQFETRGQDSWRSTFVIAVQTFANVLCSQYPQQRLAQTTETSFMRYKNPNR